MNRTCLNVELWGVVGYEEALKSQQEMQLRRIKGEIEDTLVMVEHPPVVTLGLRGGDDDLRCSPDRFGQGDVALYNINRGGFATAHEPGQLVAYPIVLLKKKDLRWYSLTFLQSLADTLADFNLDAEFHEGEPGLWVNGSKIASFGIAVKKWVSSHGIALNVNNDLATFDLIVPCGKPGEKVTSMRREVGYGLSMDDVAGRFLGHFCDRFAYCRPELENRFDVAR